MILKKEFYFVRHGQTDHNISHQNLKEDHPPHIPLNETGRQQAQLIEPLIASLPIQTICASPMKRVQETREIIAVRLQAACHELEHLSECNSQMWREMVRRGMGSSIPDEGDLRLFFDRVLKGINHALSLPGPLLVVAHGGVHWALCCLMAVQDHAWALDNCGVVHFSVDSTEQWVAKRLKTDAGL